MSNFDSRSDTLMRKVGIAVVTGALVFSTLPTAAIAAETTATGTTGATSTSTSAAGPSGGSSSDKPGEPPSGGMGGGEQSGQPGEPPDGGGAGGGFGGGANTMTFDYSGTFSGAVTADGAEKSVSDQAIDASAADQNAALAQNGGTLSLTGVTLTKSGDDTNGDNCNFYGLNSILLAVGSGSTAKIQNSSLSATSEGSNGIFATNDAVVWAKNVSISTTAGNSRGLDATYGGTIVADEVTVNTQGDHCAAVATDRGGGNVSVTNSTLNTQGSGSPILYSTGDVEVSGVTGTSQDSQLVGMEGLNTVLINNSTLTSTNTEKTASDPVADGIIIYQSTSGDAESTTGETATFQAADSTLSSAIQSGSMFYLTNTSADVVLKNTVLDFDSTAADLLLVAGNDSNNWGSAGSNGATVRFTGISQELAGNIDVDTISSADVHLTQGTIWTGAATVSQNAYGSTSETPPTVNIDATSTWVVTGDSTVSALNVAEGGQVVDAQGNTVTIVSGGKTVVEGTSQYTVTVTGSYTTSYDISNAGELSQSLIDRGAFDAEYGCETSFAMGDSAKAASATTASSASTSVDTSDTSSSSGSFWDAMVNWFKGLFGMV